MAQYQRTPSQGLKILEQLYKNNPNHQRIANSLVNAYIHFGFHDKAMDMIANIPDSKSDVTSLKFKAWAEYKNENIAKEREVWNRITNNNFFVQIHNKINTLIRRTEQDIIISEQDIPLFCVERNEIMRLPFFLKYYRDLGVTKFTFINNNSDDGSFEFLLAQPDCHVFWTNDSFLESGHGLTWLNYLINESSILNNDQWYIIADTDEILVYPLCEKANLTYLIKYLNKSNSESVPSFMLDMYSNELLPRTINSNIDLINEYPYFYNNYHEYYQVESPYTVKSGGIRSLLFHENNMYFVKTSLFRKLDTRNILISSTHQTTPTKTSSISSAFLHFKFINDFDKYSKIEVKRKQHSGSGNRYRIYSNKIKDSYKLENLKKTTRYKNSQQLIELGLIQCPEDWKAFIKDEVDNE